MHITRTEVGHFYSGGHSNFRYFSPEHKTLAVELDTDGRRIELAKGEDGYFTASVSPLPKGTLYWLLIDGKVRIPDPYSRRQPFSVHGASMIDEPYRPEEHFPGVKAEDAIIYELHVGTFTREGTLHAAEKKIGYLKSLGINVIELMPMAEFPGERDWGYDGTYLFALENSYGTYSDLQSFISAAHGAGIAVILDVVYNHFGPEGNYSQMLAPFMVSSDTPWGQAVNFDSKNNSGIRDFFLGNIRYWLAEAGFDGFRADATAFIVDTSKTPILRAMNDLAKEIGREENREILMIAEHLRNDVKVTDRKDGFAFDAQWCDDFAHATEAVLTGEREGPYQNFGPFDDILTVFSRTFVMDGSRFDYFEHMRYGSDGSDVPPSSIVAYTQNHDQIGNRPCGDRFIASFGKSKAKAFAAALFISPYVPMLFMGEEYGETAPFYFFESFSDKGLIKAVENGRKNMFAQNSISDVPAPHSEEAFEKCRLNWDLAESPDGKEMLDFYKALISLKKRGIIGNRCRQCVMVCSIGGQKVLKVDSEKSISFINFDTEPYPIVIQDTFRIALESEPFRGGMLQPYAALILEKK